MSEYITYLIQQFSLPLQNPVLVFSLVLIIILLSPILLKKLNIPGIIGLIISGVIIGPHGFGILENNSAIDLFSTIGLLYIMFIAGLELDLNDFKTHRNKSLLFALFTFAIPLAIGIPVCYYILHYDFNASFLTASMFATHTLVAYPIVSKLGASKNQAVAITVGGTVLTDTAVLIILAIIMGNSKGDLGYGFWIQLGISLSVFSVIMFWIIPKIAKWFFSTLENEKHSHYIFVLSIVFFAAFLAEMAGVEAIIGAFMAGLAINKLIPASSALMNRIEFIGNALFIPFFLISVGMLVNIHVILSGPATLIVAGVLTIVAISGKWLAAWLTQKTFRYSAAQRQVIFGLSGSHAAATLAIVLVGYNAGILDEAILNGTIILILITCVIASFITEKSAKKMKLEDEEITEDLQNNSVQNREQLLLPIKDLNNFDRLLELSFYLKDKNSPQPISVLSVVSNDKEAETNILKAQNKLEEFVKQGAASEVEVNILTTIDHDLSSGILRISREIMANIIIINLSSSSSSDNKLLRHKTEYILNKSSKTFFICQMKHPIATYKKVVVAIPPLAEKEEGFLLWLQKITILTKELSVPLQLFCTHSTFEAMNEEWAKSKTNILTEMVFFENWDDFLVISKEIEEDDLLIVISARRGSLSHNKILNTIPLKIQQYFMNNSVIIIYPQQSEEFYEQNLDYDNDFSTVSLGLERFSSWTKKISQLFKKSSNK